MSTLQDRQSFWNISSDNTNLKYEKCRNITEEIYKRIDITFKIKKLETCTQSESEYNSDQIDSNELSNETDLFACDKSSISSSTELEALEQGSAMCEKFINNNNNNEEMKKKPTVVYKRPRKRFRKRVKKQQHTKRDSDGSSDEALPLSRVIDLDVREARVIPSPSHTVMGVPNVVITPIDLKKFKLPLLEKKTPKKPETKQSSKESKDTTINKTIDIEKGTDKKQTIDKTDGKEKVEWSCTICSLSFRGERGLRRHMTMSHMMNPLDTKKTNKKEEST